MLALGLTFLKSRLGVGCIVAALVLGAIGVQTLRANHYKASAEATAKALTAEKATSAALRASVAAAETNRKAEYANATAAAGGAETQCLARVAAAHTSAGKIRTLVEKPHAPDPTTGCPARALLGAGELRDALRPAGP